MATSSYLWRRCSGSLCTLHLLSTAHLRSFVPAILTTSSLSVQCRLFVSNFHANVVLHIFSEGIFSSYGLMMAVRRRTDRGDRALVHACIVWISSCDKYIIPIEQEYCWFYGRSIRYIAFAASEKHILGALRYLHRP